VARFTDTKLEKLLLDPGIVRNRLKVFAAKNNALRFLEIRMEFGSFDKYIWEFVGGKPIVNAPKSMREIAPTTPESDALSKDLIMRGFKFVGSTVIYAHMQACGLVNDHLQDCFRYKETRILK
jgi:DNA-3-methyladenine glycosylase I